MNGRGTNGVTNIVLAGVGGQGILLASEVIARAAMHAGRRVKTNEVHGMAQRGGSVLAQLRFGPEVWSPLVAEGEAAALVSFEFIEALRHRRYLAPDGTAIVSKQRIVPVTVSSGRAVYPADVEARLCSAFPRLVSLDAVGAARELGDARAANLVLVGALSTRLEISERCWERAIADSVKPESLQVNTAAFNKGRSLS